MYSDKQNPIPPHIFTEMEREVFQSITELLRKGGKVIVGNEWKNRDGKGGYFEVRILQRDKIHVFELDSCIPMIFDGII